MLRMQRIQSEIQHTIYRVDSEDAVPDELLDGFLEHIGHWRQNMPKLPTDMKPEQSPTEFISYAQLHLNDSYVSSVLCLLYRCPIFPPANRKLCR